jgi:hypothetical protein
MTSACVPVPRRRRRHEGFFWVTVTGSALLVSIAVLVSIWYLTVVRAVSGINFSGITDAVEAGATSSWMASNTARTDHVPDGAAMVPFLNKQWSNYKWFSAGTAVPPSGATKYVSIGAGPDDVVTAQSLGAETGGCAYGVTVTSASDPVISRFGLPGPGTYWAGSGTVANQCSASTAPLTGWSAADGSVLVPRGKPLHQT